MKTNQPQGGNPQVTVITLSVSDLRELIREEVERAMGGIKGNGQGEQAGTDGKLLSVKELASSLGVKESWVYWQTFKKDSGRIPAVQVGRYLRFRLSEVYSWLESKRSK